MNKLIQTRFWEIEDLPLFSGTPLAAREQVFAPKEVNAQPTLAHCRLCHDTGRLGPSYCWCDAGQQARQSQP